MTYLQLFHHSSKYFVVSRLNGRYWVCACTVRLSVFPVNKLLSGLRWGSLRYPIMSGVRRHVRCVVKNDKKSATKENFKKLISNNFVWLIFRKYKYVQLDPETNFFNNNGLLPRLQHVSIENDAAMNACVLIKITTVISINFFSLLRAFVRKKWRKSTKKYITH